MNAEAKVGAFTVSGLLALAATTFTLGNVNFGSDDNYILYAGFKQVIGLENQAAVRLSGVPIGKVTNIGNDGGGVTVTMEIEPKVNIPKNSSVMVASSGVMGEKFVNITPAKDNGDYLQNGDYLYGVDEAGMDAMFEGLSHVMDKVEELLVSLNKVAGNPTLQNSLVDMSTNMKNASEHMDGLMESLERMSKDNEGNINQMTTQINQMLDSMNRTVNSVENMAANMDTFVGDPKTAEELKTTLANISSTSKNIAHMAENMDKVIGDPKTAEDMKSTISNAKNLTERADKMLGKVDGAVKKLSNTTVKPSVEMLYSGSAHDWNTNFNIDVENDGTSLDIGVEDIGDNNKFNAQVGKKINKVLGARAGVIAGKPGVGIDAYAGDKFKFSAEAYNPNKETFRLKTQYEIAEDTYLSAEWHDITHSDKRAAYFGLKRDF